MASHEEAQRYLRIRSRPTALSIAVGRWRGSGNSGTTPLDVEQGSNLAPMTDDTSTDTADELERLQAELAGSDPAVVISNHCYGLFELAAVYLSLQPPRLSEAQMAVDALAGVIEGLGERLGDSAEPLKEGLAQLRLAWVQLAAAQATDEELHAP